MIKTFNEFLNESYKPLLENANREAAWRTEVQEEMTCLIFNKVFGNSANNYNIDFIEIEAENPYNSNGSDFLTDRLHAIWIEIARDGEYKTSFKCQVESLKKWASSRRINLNNYYFVRHESTIHPDEARDITKRVLDGVKATKKSNSISRFMKDNYQKADIYAIKKGADIGEFPVDGANANEDGTRIEHSLWVSEINGNKPDFFGISLKKISSVITPKIIDECPYTIKNVTFIAPTATTASGYILFDLCEKTGEKEHISHKRFNVHVSSGSLVIEMIGKNTRDGSVKVMFNIMMNGIDTSYEEGYVFNNIDDKIVIDKNAKKGETYNRVMSVFSSIDRLIDKKIKDPDYKNETDDNDVDYILNNDIVYNLYLSAKGYNNKYHMTLP